MDGQDYETAANLIGGNQFIAAANFIDMLDTMPREHMMTLIYKNKKLWNEMWYFDECGFFCTREAGIFSEFAEEAGTETCDYRLADWLLWWSGL